MQSMLNVTETDRPDAAIAPPDEHIARAYRPYMRATLGSRHAAAERELAHDANRHASVAELSGVNIHSAARNGWSRRRSLVVSLLAGSIGVAMLLRFPYGEAARKMISVRGPQPVVTSSVRSSERQMRSAAETAAATSSAPAQSAVAAQEAQQNTSETMGLSAEQGRLLETLQQDLADLERRLEQLKVSQQQMARDNATALEELRTKQDQMALAASENTTAIAQLKAEQGQMDQTASRNAKPFVDLKMGQEKIARAVASERRSARRRSGRANRLALPRDSIEPHESQAKMVVEPAIRSQPSFAPRVPAPLL